MYKKEDYSKYTGYSDFDPTPSPKLFGEKPETKEQTNTPPPPVKQRTFKPKQKNKNRGSFSR